MPPPGYPDASIAQRTLLPQGRVMMKKTRDAVNNLTEAVLWGHDRSHVYESVATVSYYAQFSRWGIDMGGGSHGQGRGCSHGQGREFQLTTLQKLCYEAVIEAMCMSLLLLFRIMHSSLDGMLIWEAVHMDRGGGSYGQGREMQSTTLQKLCYEAMIEAMCMSLLLLFLIMHSSLHRALIWEGGSHGQGRGFTWTREEYAVSNLTEAVLWGHDRSHVYESVATVSYYVHFTTQGIDTEGGSHGQGRGFTWTREGFHMDGEGDAVNNLTEAVLWGHGRSHVYESVATVSYYAQFTTQGIDMGGGVRMDRVVGQGQGCWCSQQPYRSCVMRPR